MYDTTFLVFASDNGANTLVQGSGSNYPLRGQKGYLFDGGFRVPAFVHSPLIPPARRGVEYGELFHITDWLPTLLDGLIDSRAVLEGKSLNGVSHWAALVHGNGSVPRTEVLYNIDTLGSDGRPLGFDVAALRVGRWKLIENELNVTTYPVPEADEVLPNRVPNNGEPSEARHSFLFDLEADPEERVDLYTARPDVVANLTAILAIKYRSRMVESEYCSLSDNMSHATWRQQGSFIGPWRDVNDRRGCVV